MDKLERDLAKCPPRAVTLYYFCGVFSGIALAFVARGLWLDYKNLYGRK